jgi:hypothetical protein
VKRFQKPSLPFVFDLPVLSPVPNRGETVTLGLVLAGSAVIHLPLYLAALRRALGPAVALTGAAALDAAGTQVPLLEHDRVLPDRLALLTPTDLLAGRDQYPERLTVSYITPLRFVRDGRALKEIAFGDLVRGLLRRLSSLAHYYGGVELPLDYRWLAERSAAVATESAAFRWIDQGGGRCGVTGQAVYGGELAEFVPLLSLGELFHLGKGCAWGQGSYRLSTL